MSCLLIAKFRKLIGKTLHDISFELGIGLILLFLDPRAGVLIVLLWKKVRLKNNDFSFVLLV